MAWIDSLSLGVLITALCIFLAGAVTVHAALEGRLSRGWAIAWLVVFAGLGAIAIVNGAHEAADRRHADEQVISREQTESHNWQELFERLPRNAPVAQPSRPRRRFDQLGLSSVEPSPRTGGIRRLTRGEKAKLTVLLSAMTPYAVQIFNTENPTSRGCADDLEEAFFDAGWTITIRQTIRDAFGYTVVGGPPSLGPLPPEPDLNDFVGTKALAVIGMLQDFHLHVGGMGVGVHPANTISVIVGDEPPVADSSSASYPPHAAD